MLSPAVLIAAAVTAASASTIRTDLRRDGVPVVLLGPGQLEKEMLASGPNIPFRNFSAKYVHSALNSDTDFRKRKWVTPAKDQGAHGYCGTFGRVAAAEGQYARFRHSLRNFSEEELVDCIGWDKDQFSYFSRHGFMDSGKYPYNTTGPDMDPPIPGNPCKYAKKEVIAGTDKNHFHNQTGAAPSEDQLVAFVHHNGPVQTGINANVFGLRAKGCEDTGDCWITKEMCNDPKVKGKPIDHSITLVGYGTDKTNGPYWIVKNSWSEKFGNDGFINVARGISCASIDCCGNTFVYGNASKYYEE